MRLPSRRRCSAVITTIAPSTGRRSNSRAGTDSAEPAQTIRNASEYLHPPRGCVPTYLLYDESDRLARATIALGERTSLPTRLRSATIPGGECSGRGHWTTPGPRSESCDEGPGVVRWLAWRGASSASCRPCTEGRIGRGFGSVHRGAGMCEQTSEQRLSDLARPEMPRLSRRTWATMRTERSTRSADGSARAVEPTCSVAWTLTTRLRSDAARDFPRNRNATNVTCRSCAKRKTRSGRNVTIGRVAEGSCAPGE